MTILISQFPQNIEAICAECHQELTKIPALYQALQEKVPPGEFYRYHHNFRGTTHRLVAATCFITYLEENRCVGVLLSCLSLYTSGYMIFFNICLMLN